MFENQKNFEIENQANDLLLFEALEELKAIKKRAVELKEVIHASMESYTKYLCELSKLLSRSNSQLDNVEVKETGSIENDGIFLINDANNTKFEVPISVSQKSVTDIRQFLVDSGNFTNLTDKEAYQNVRKAPSFRWGMNSTGKRSFPLLLIFACDNIKNMKTQIKHLKALKVRVKDKQINRKIRL